MELLILRTNIKSSDDFNSMKDSLINLYQINDCTIDLEDYERVVRVIGKNIRKHEIISGINELGFECEELPD
jgi:hypothetical protein